MLHIIYRLPIRQKWGLPSIFAKIGYERVRWLPLAQPIEYPHLTLDEIRNRSMTMAYVGAPTGSKIDRLKALDPGIWIRSSIVWSVANEGLLWLCAPPSWRASFFPNSSTNQSSG